MLSEVISFVFKLKLKKKTINFSRTSIYWDFKGARRRFFTKQTPANTMSFVINKCFFTNEY